MIATIKELEAHQKKYQENFDNIIKYEGRPSQKKYLSAEKKLNHSGITLRKRLGIFAQDPCPLPNPKGDCLKCQYFNCIIKKGGMLG